MNCLPDARKQGFLALHHIHPCSAFPRSPLFINIFGPEQHLMFLHCGYAALKIYFLRSMTVSAASIFSEVDTQYRASVHFEE